MVGGPVARGEPSALEENVGEDVAQSGGVLSPELEDLLRTFTAARERAGEEGDEVGGEPGGGPDAGGVPNELEESTREEVTQGDGDLSPELEEFLMGFAAGRERAREEGDGEEGDEEEGETGERRGASNAAKKRKSRRGGGSKKGKGARALATAQYCQAGKKRQGTQEAPESE